MAEHPAPSPAFDVGIYTLAEAARLVSRHGRIHPNTVRYWLRTGLTQATLGRGVGGALLLTFHDLISLEVVALFRQRGVSLQRVRLLESRLRQRYPGVDRPFAHDAFFTDGSAVWHELHPEDSQMVEVIPDGSDLVEIIGERPGQVAWRSAIRAFAQEVRYEIGAAAAWFPHPLVEVNPRVQFGAPVVAGTRLPIRVLKQELKTAPAGDVADWHGLTEDEVMGVSDYLHAA